MKCSIIDQYAFLIYLKFMHVSPMLYFCLWERIIYIVILL